MSSVSVVGLGRVGACMAAAMSHKGLNVVGVDLDPSVVAAINSGKAPVVEPGLDDLIANNSTRLSATTNYREAILGTNITFVVVPTPSEENGGFALRHVISASEAIGAALKEDADYHLVVLTSTVLPGSTAVGMVSVLERESGRRCGQDFGVCYSPEFIALGTVIRDFLNPDFVLIGESDNQAGDKLSDFYGRVLDRDVPIQRMAIPNAEIAKIALNTFVTTKITFANMLAQMCEAVPGGDVDAVTAALGHDSRIGARYFSAGLGYGGPCFPRDNRALRYWASQVGTPALLAHSTDDLNRELGQLTLLKLREHCRPGATIAFLGLTYKQGSSVLEGSSPLYLAARLAEEGVASVIAHDPLRATLQHEDIDRRIELVESLPQALARADVVVVASPDPSFRGLQAGDFPGERTVVIDCWRLLRPALEHAPNIDYVALGVSPQAAEIRSTAIVA